jgi:hypothetical protein
MPSRTSATLSDIFLRLQGHTLPALPPLPPAPPLLPRTSPSTTPRTQSAREPLTPENMRMSACDDSEQGVGQDVESHEGSRRALHAATSRKRPNVQPPCEESPRRARVSPVGLAAAHGVVPATAALPTQARRFAPIPATVPLPFRTRPPITGRGSASTNVQQSPLSGHLRALQNTFPGSAPPGMAALVTFFQGRLDAYISRFFCLFRSCSHFLFSIYVLLSPHCSEANRKRRAGNRSSFFSLPLFSLCFAPLFPVGLPHNSTSPLG